MNGTFPHSVYVYETKDSIPNGEAIPVKVVVDVVDVAVVSSEIVLFSE